MHHVIMGLLCPAFRSRPGSFCMRSGRLGKKPKKLSFLGQENMVLYDGWHTMEGLCFLGKGRRTDLILSVPAHILGMQNANILELLVHLPTEQEAQGFSSFLGQAPSLPHCVCFTGICKSPGGAPASCSFGSAVSLCCVFEQGEVINNPPQLLPGNEANQSLHLGTVYSEQILISYILFCLKYQLFSLVTFFKLKKKKKPEPNRVLLPLSIEASLGYTSSSHVSHRISSLSFGSVHTLVPCTRCWNFPLLCRNVCCI